MKNLKLNLTILRQKLAVCRLEKDSELPSWIFNNDFFSVTKTDDELSSVCCDDIVPENIKANNKIEPVLIILTISIVLAATSPLFPQSIGFRCILPRRNHVPEMSTHRRDINY